jgi:hypothetical protein
VQRTKIVQKDVAMHNGAVHNASCASQHKNHGDKQMSVYSKPIQMGKDLLQINRNTFKDIVAIQVGGVRRVAETNQVFLRKVPGFRSISAIVDAQKDYNRTLWTGARADFVEGNDVLRSAVEETRATVSAAYADMTKAATKPAPRKRTKKSVSAKSSAARKPVAKKAASKKPAAKRSTTKAA